GRFFTDQDRFNSPPVAIVNETMAKAYWPGENPVGKRFQFPSHHANPWITVVGVTGDMHRQGLEKQVAPQVFHPNAQEPDDMLEMVVRTSAEPRHMMMTVQ